jgi:hypothetical protein
MDLRSSIAADTHHWEYTDQEVRWSHGSESDREIVMSGLRGI